MNKYILTYSESVLFEIVEICVLLMLVIYYIFTNKIILSILYAIPFIEHLLEIKYKDRQKGGSLVDYITLMYLLGIAIYSVYIDEKISIAIALFGTMIHLITIYTKSSFARVVGFQDIIDFIAIL